MLDANGGNRVNLVEHVGFSFDFSWSPDSTRLAMAGGTGYSQIYVVSADGSSGQQLFEDPTSASEPRWSPDGSRIAFTSARSGNGDIYVIDADGGGLRNLTEGSDQAEREPRWAPDSSKLVYTQGDFTLHVVDVASGESTLLATDPVSAQYPRWSPDGTTIAFFGATAEERGLFLMNADGSDVRFSGHPMSTQEFSWLPSGRELVLIGATVLDLDANQTRSIVPEEPQPSWARFRPIP